MFEILPPARVLAGLPVEGMIPEGRQARGPAALLRYPVPPPMAHTPFDEAAAACWNRAE